MLEIKFGHELNVQRYTWHARLPDNAIHNNVICITQNYWYHDIALPPSHPRVPHPPLEIPHFPLVHYPAPPASPLVVDR